MKRLFALCAVIFTAVAAINAEPAAITACTTTVAIKSVSGTVTDANTQEPLAGVTLECSGKKYYSDLEGKFTLSVPATSQEKIDVSLISYQTSTIVLEANVNTLEVSIKQR
jgi:hypothetical protein